MVTMRRTKTTLTKTTLMLAAMTLVTAVAGCHSMRAKPKPMIAREGALTHGETLQYVGVDFTRTLFFDPYLRYDDAVQSKIPTWSSHALEDASV